MRQIMVALSAIPLIGCDPPSEGTGNAYADASSAILEDQLIANMAGLEQAPPSVERVRAAMAEILSNADTVRYLNLRNGRGGAICGEVDPTGQEGSSAGPRPFVVTPGGVAAISRSPRLALNDPEDPFPDLYIPWCASPDELAALQQQMAAGPPRRVEIPVDEEEEELRQPAGPDATAPPHRPSPPPQRRDGTSRRSEIRNFSDAVLRPDNRTP